MEREAQWFKSAQIEVDWLMEVELVCNLCPVISSMIEISPHVIRDTSMFLMNSSSMISL